MTLWRCWPLEEGFGGIKGKMFPTIRFAQYRMIILFMIIPKYV